MRRRNIATAISIAPKPVDAASDAFDAIEARRKLEVAIEDQKSKAEAAESEFARTFARGLHLVPAVNADSALQKNEIRKAVQDRFQQRIQALQNILDVMNKFLEQLKYDSPDAVNAALNRKVEVLEKMLSEHEQAETDLEEQIKKLKAEINKLPKTPAKKTA